MTMLSDAIVFVGVFEQAIMPGESEHIAELCVERI